MICQLCGKKEATVCLNIDMNGQRSTLFICEDCAEERKLKNNPSPAVVLAIIKEIQNKAQTEEKPDIPDRHCESCGHSFAEFQKTSLLGCKDCYRYFADLLTPYFDKITKPSPEDELPPASAPINNEVLKLQLQLKRCIESENYEEAAKIRDTINTIKSKTEEESNG